MTSAHQFTHNVEPFRDNGSRAVASVPTPWHCLFLWRTANNKIYTSLNTHTKELGESVADAWRGHFQADAKMLGDVDDVVFRLARPKIMLQKSNTYRKAIFLI